MWMYVGFFSYLAANFVQTWPEYMYNMLSRQTLLNGDYRRIRFYVRKIPFSDLML